MEPRTWKETLLGDTAILVWMAAALILLCRQLRQPWDQFWKNFQSFG